MTILTTLLLSFVVFAAVFVAMGVGVMAGRKPIKGSCGGLNGRGCELCSGVCRDRVKTQEELS